MYAFTYDWTQRIYKSHISVWGFLPNRSFKNILPNWMLKIGFWKTHSLLKNTAIYITTLLFFRATSPSVSNIKKIHVHISLRLMPPWNEYKEEQ